MSAETLRKASALMRERAEGSTAGPWLATEQTHGEWFGIQSQWTALGTAFELVEAQHIASWHPAVALAVADWLDECADVKSNPDVNAALKIALTDRAAKVARAYLGEQS